MAVRTITKQLAGVEDLLLGKGTEEQVRNGKTLTITKIDMFLPVDLLADLKPLDTTMFTKALTLGSTSINDGSGGLYYFDSTDITTPENLPDVVIPDSLIGRWNRLTLNVS